MKRHQLIVAAVALGLLTAPGRTHAQGLTSGNIVVTQGGSGSEALNSNGTNAFLLRQFTQTGFTVSGWSDVNVSSASLGSNAIYVGANSTTEGYLNRTPNGLSLALAGYSTSAGTSLSGSTVNRAVGMIDALGSVNRIVDFAVTSPNPGGNRSAVVSGSNVWLATSAAGILYANANPPPATTTTPVFATIANTRVVNIFNDQLFFSTNSGTTRGVYIVGTAGPPTSSATAVSVVNAGSSASPYAFAFDTAMSVAYVADDRAIGTNTGGIQKWVNDGNGNWTIAYTLGTGTGSIVGARGLAADFTDPMKPVLYATTAETTGNRLIKITDTGGSSAATNLQTAPANPNATVFRGVEIALKPATWNATTSGNWQTATTATVAAGTTIATKWTNWSDGVADGINLAFSNVGTAAITATNNTSITNYASITFRPDGRAASGNTAYTLDGSAVTLIGGANTSAGGTLNFNASNYAVAVLNNSGVGQTVNLPLRITGDQAFLAQNGGLAFGGNITLGQPSGSGRLVVAGPGNTTVTGVISNASGATNGLTKTDAGTLTLNGVNTFTGPTTVAGGTLRGEGTLNGAVAVNLGGTVRGGSPANPTSPLTVNNTVTVAGASSGAGTLAVDLNGATTTGATVGRLGLTAGTLNFDTSTNAGPVAVQLLNDGGLSPNTPYSFVIANGQAGGFKRNGTTVTSYAYTTDFTLSSSNFTGFSGVSLAVNGSNNLVLAFTTPVPEPAAVLGVAAAALGVARVVRRRLPRSVG